MEKNELIMLIHKSRIPDPDDPNDLLMPTDNANSHIGNFGNMNIGSAALGNTNNIGSVALNTFRERVVPKVHFIEGGNKIDLESSSSKHEKHQPNSTKVGSAALNTFTERVVTPVNFIERGNKIDLENSSAARRRNIEMLKNELPRVPDPNDLTEMLSTSANLNTFKEREVHDEVERGNNDLESSSSKHEKHNNKDGFAALNTFTERVATCANLNTLTKTMNTCANLNTFTERVVPKVNIELESSSSKHEKRQPNDTKIEIKELEKFLGVTCKLKDIHVPVPECCIYKVPKHLRKINEEAYTPQVISIGPFHHGEPKLSEMENQKLIYISEFQKRELGDEKLMRFKSFIEDNVKFIRNYYQVNSGLSNPKFVNMILRDAVFIIEFFLKSEQQEREYDYFLDTACVKAVIACDLQLLENQLPYFLLKKLFEGAFPNFTKNDHPDHDPFLILSRRFFFDPKDDVFPKPNNEIQKYEIQHFTDLRRYFLLMDFPPEDQKQGEHVKDLPTATKLHGSGVKFKKVIEDGSSLEISCESVPRTMRIPCFKECEIRIPFTKTLELQIPRLEIDDQSECLYRNMMALELCHYPSKTHICNFILLMDYLINNEKDVDLFVEKEIIFSMLGDNAKVATMFNNLCLQITQSFSVYHDISEKLKKHYHRSLNHTMATLNTVYFGDMWKGTATVAAFILLVLTTIQAVCSIMSLL